MRRSMCRNFGVNPNREMDAMMLKFFQGVARKKDAGVTSDDFVVAMRRQNPYKFVNREVQKLVHSALGTDGVDAMGFRNFAARIIGENIENYLNEYMEALQVGNEGCLTRYRLEMLFSQEIGADVNLTKDTFESLTDDAVITVETVWLLLEDNKSLLSCLVRHIFRKELSADSGDNVLDRFTSTTADQLSRRRRRTCCSLM